MWMQCFVAYSWIISWIFLIFWKKSISSPKDSFVSLKVRHQMQQNTQNCVPPNAAKHRNPYFYSLQFRGRQRRILQHSKAPSPFFFTPYSLGGRQRQIWLKFKEVKNKSISSSTSSISGFWLTRNYPYISGKSTYINLHPRLGVSWG